MTKIEISRRLALAIGYTADRVRIREHCFADGTACKWIEVLNDYSRGDGPMQYSGWQRLDHTDPAVIWPIAERFDAFPKHRFNYACEHVGWHCWAMDGGYGAHINPATASALAVIAYVEGTK